jgi:hypothetical protein
MINIGGMHEADYLGFEDFVPDPRQDKEMQDYWVHGRPFTSAITADTVNICFRSTPVDAFIRGEIRRIAMRDARLTIVGKIIDPKLIDFVRGIGIIESTGAVWDVYSKVGRRKEPHIPRRENSRAAPVISVANLIADLKAPAPGIGAQRTRRAGQEGGSVSLSHLPTASDLGSPPPL